ncbi:MAG: class I SAM-dependent methyltransferase [Pseudonocardiales bacterium]|nr:class I SAM-dependent methyltransferase [Pseudonocardiales bacterium]MBV9030950.1 class I SAM-dependent methyltransferase [Pseudonocardiales bacterium]
MGGQIDVTDELLDYVRRVSLRDDAILSDLRAATAALPAGRVMQVMPEEAQLLALLVSVTNANRVLEIGTFTGYSTLCMARALPADGRLVTCDISEKWPAIASPYWERAGVADRIHVRIGDAGETLAELLAAQGPDSFDFVFIDADKANYRRYYEDAVTLVKPGGLVAIDNTLFLGRVIDPTAQDPDTTAIRELNATLHDDDRVEMCLLVMADGITLIHKKLSGAALSITPVIPPASGRAQPRTLDREGAEACAHRESTDCGPHPEAQNPPRIGGRLENPYRPPG